MQLPGPEEIEFQEKEKELTDAVIKVIAMAKKEIVEISNSIAKQNVVDACKAAANATFEFQAIMKECRRPYLSHSYQLFNVFNKIEHALFNVEDVVASAKTGAANENAEDVVKELHDARAQASKVSANFRRWLLTTPSCYLFASERVTELLTAEPTNPSEARSDLMRCPKWILRQLLEARQTQMRAMDLQSELQQELNELKLNSNTLRQEAESKYLAEIEEKDQQIKKLNLQLREFYKHFDLKEGATFSPTQIEEKIGKLMEATIQKNEEIESLRAQLTKTEEKSRRDQMELKRLKDEIQRLKFLVNESPGTNSESGQQNRNIPSGMESVTQNTTPPDSNSTVKLPSTYGLRAASEPSSLTPLSPSGKLSGLSQPTVTTSTSEARRSAQSQQQYIKEPEDDDEDELDFENVPETSYNDSKIWMSEQQKRMAMAKMLYAGFDFLELLGKAIPKHQGEEFITAIVKLFEHRQKIFKFIKYIIRQELAKTKDPSILFRSDEFPSRVMRLYIKTVGKDYITATLKDLINQVQKSNPLYEVDPLRLNAGEGDVKENFVKLEELTQQFLDAILSSGERMPIEFRKICRILVQEVRQQFPHKENQALAGLIFLRFFCPAIAAPESFNLSPTACVHLRRYFTEPNSS
jgi:hypothetical protein